MSFVFGGARPSQENTIKMYKREIGRHIRSIERDMAEDMRREKTTIAEIKRLVNKEDMQMAHLRARHLAQQRQYRKRLAHMQQGLHTIEHQLTVIHSSQHSQEVLAKTTRILQALNGKMNVASTYKMIQEFERQNTAMAEKQDILSESMDSLFEADDAEVDSTMCAVFEELGLSDKIKLVPSADKQQALLNDTDLEHRLERLRARQQ